MNKEKQRLIDIYQKTLKESQKKAFETRETNKNTKFDNDISRKIRK